MDNHSSTDNNYSSMPTNGPAYNATDDIFFRYPSLVLLFETFAPVSVWSERVVPPVWYVIGFVGNPISAIIWCGRRMRRNNSSAVYLGSLAVSDTVFLLLHLLHNLHSAWGKDVYNAPGGCEAFMFFFYIPQYMSVILVAAFTVERYVAVCHPFMKEKWCTVRRACVLVVLCLIFSAALASAQTYIWTYHPGIDVCNTRPEAAEGDHESFWNIWTWTVEMLMFAALPLVVLVFNVLVLREILKLSRNGVITRQNQGRSEGASTTASTVTILSVSFFLIITQLTATLVISLQLAFPIGPRFLSDQEVRADPTWSRLFTYLDWRKVLETVCLSHFACYFFVYVLTGKHFRRELVYLCTCHGKLPCLDRGFTKSHRGERYSMVSSNGNSFTTNTCATSFTTSM